MKLGFMRERLKSDCAKQHAWFFLAYEFGVGREEVGTEKVGKHRDEEGKSKF